MYRNATTGYWEEDFRRKGIARLHVSYGVKKRSDAEPASAAMKRVFREKRVDLIDRIRAGDVTAHQLAGIIADDKPLGSALEERGEPWPTVAEAITAYVQWMFDSERKSDATAAQAERQLKHFAEFVGADVRVDSITSSQVTDYQRHLYTKFQQNTVATTIWRVSGLYNWLVRQEKRLASEAGRSARMLHVPIDHDQITTTKTRRERYLTEPEAERLVAATPPMLLFPVLCGLLAGLRIEETLHLRPGFDIDLTLGLITIQKQPEWQPKNGKRRVVPIAPQLRPVIEHHIARYASEDWMIPMLTRDERPLDRSTMAKQFRTIVRNAELVSGRADPKGIVYHTLRHTFASWLVMKGVDLYTVSQLLGNSLTMVETTYAHLAPDFRQRAVDRLAGIIFIADLPQNTEQDGPSDGGRE